MVDKLTGFSLNGIEPPVLRGLNLPKKNPINIKAESFNSSDMFSVSRTLNENSKTLGKIYNLPILENVFNNTSVAEFNPASASTTNALNKIEGTKWSGKLDSNGGRDVAIILPKNYDPSKPTEVVYHFHGHNGTVSSVLIGGNGLKDKIDSISKEKNIVVVIPQGPSKKNDHDWMKGSKGEDMDKFEKDTLNIIKTQIRPDIKIGSITIEGHSAGGLPIMNAAVEGKIHANKITLMDSSYGDWATQAYANIIKNSPNTKFNVVYIPNSQTQSDAIQLKGKPNVTMITSKVSHGEVPKTFFGI